MTPVPGLSLAFARPVDADAATAAVAVPGTAGASQAVSRERRAFARFDPVQLSDPLVARVKYGETVRLVDVSAGGALFETSTALRPESTLVLEMMGAGAQESISVVSRVLRCHVSDVRGGVRYRGACAFKRPLDHPALIAPLPPQPSVPDSFARPEFALKTIVEAYRRRAQAASTAAGWQHTSALVDSLARLRDAAEQRADGIDRRLGQMLAAILPLLQRHQSPDDVTSEVLVQLSRHMPGLTIRLGGGSRPIGAGDAERLTLNVWPEPAERATITAEYPTGFDMDESQFRLLKAGAYLLGLAESWIPGEPSADPAAEDVDVAADLVDDEVELPAGWQRVVVRYVDGELLRGYSNNFHPDAAHLHLSPDLSCAPGNRLLVPIARLKAVFFVRNLAGNPEYVDSNAFDHAPRARKVEVTFRDGEVIAGSTLNYKPDGQGFFLAPANSRGNNHRIFVVLAAVRHLRFL